MEYTVLTLLREYWPVVLFALFGGFLLRRGASKHREALVARNTEAARQQGMAYVAPGGLDVNQGVTPGTHRFNQRGQVRNKTGCTPSILTPETRYPHLRMTAMPVNRLSTNMPPPSLQAEKEPVSAIGMNSLLANCSHGDHGQTLTSIPLIQP